MPQTFGHIKQKIIAVPHYVAGISRKKIQKLFETFQIAKRMLTKNVNHNHGGQALLQIWKCTVLSKLFLKQILL